MARKRSIITESQIVNAIKQGKEGLVDVEAETRAFLIDMAKVAHDPKAAAELYNRHRLNLTSRVETFGTTHVKVLNRIIKAFDVGMTNVQKLQIVDGFISANGGTAKVATLVNKIEAEKAAKLAAAKAAK